MELVQKFLRLSTDGRHFNPSHELTVAAANVICALCFGKRYGHDDPEFRTLLRRVDKFGEPLALEALWTSCLAGSAVPFPNPVRSVYQNFKLLNEEFFAYVKDKVVQHRDTYDPEVTRDISDAIIGVIEHGKDNMLTKDFVESTVTDLIGAGQDTVSTVMQWILLLLVKYPSIQTKLQEQIDKVVGRDRLPSIEDRATWPTWMPSSTKPCATPASSPSPYHTPPPQTSPSKVSTSPKTPWCSSINGPSITTLKSGRILTSSTRRDSWTRPELWIKT